MKTSILVILLGATYILLVHGRPSSTIKTHIAEDAAAVSRITIPKPIFREYIGGGQAGLKDIPVTNLTKIEVHFILAFAVDSKGVGGAPTDGNFTALWQPNLSPESIKSIRSKYNNSVRISLSVGGGVWPTFAPVTVSSWVRDAVSSLTDIVRNYTLDGLDIDYELFADNTTPSEFAQCIGEVITQLKQKKIISIVSIAPYPVTDSYYTELWKKYNRSIDMVNYQLYSEGNISADEFVRQYEYAKNMYSGGRVLASLQTVESGTAIVPSSGMDACEKIKKSSSGLPGIFIWSADQSYNNFQYEIQAQELLAS